MIDQTGIHRPTLANCLAYFATGYQQIYGNDVQIASDDQDGQLLGLLASAVDDVNQETVSAYNAYSPATAQGAGLSSNVKINGIARNVPTYSTVPVLVVGVAYTAVSPISNSDGAGNVWTVPAVTIPSSGQIAALATCTTLGAIQLGSGVALTIQNPTLGLQSVTTTATATLGSAVELDASLRIRQSSTTQGPSLTMLGSIRGALIAIPAIGRLAIYQNDTDSPDANGVPGYSISVVCDGGDPVAIATAISSKKFACGTYGTTTETIVDSIGVPHPINFFYTATTNIICGVTIAPGPNYSTNTSGLIQNSIAAWVNALGIGTGIQLSRAWSAAYLSPSITAAVASVQAAIAANDSIALATASALLTSLNAAAATYEVTALTFAIKTFSLAAADVPIAFNAAAAIAVDAYGNPVTSSDVTVTI